MIQNSDAKWTYAFKKFPPSFVSSFVKTNHLKHLLSKLTWRKVEIEPRCTSRHHAWRSKHPATRMSGKVTVAIGFGGKVWAPCVLAGAESHADDSLVDVPSWI
jgi:hypothetical protein